MTVMRVERVVYGVADLDECVRFFERLRAGAARRRRTRRPLRDPDRAGRRAAGADDPSLPPAVEDGPTPARDRLGRRHRRSRSTSWRGPAGRPAIYTDADGVAHTVDETGFGVGLAVSQPRDRGRPNYPGANRTGNVNRWNQPLEPPGRVRPLRLCHVALEHPQGGPGGGGRLLHRPARLRAHRPGRQADGRVHARARRRRPAHAAAVPPPGPGRDQPLRVRGGPASTR